MWISFHFGKKFNPVIFFNHPIPTFHGVLLGGSETIRIAPIPVGFVISLRLQKLGGIIILLQRVLFRVLELGSG